MHKIKNTFYIIVSAIIVFPALAHAQLEGVEGLLVALRRLLNLTIPVLIALSVVYFMWGVAQFILNDASNEKTREDGKKKMLWGVIALFVMVSIFGILAFIGNTLDIENPYTNSPTNNPGNYYDLFSGQENA
ncbi:MAG: hypothetical protein ABL917_01275 [Parcubacteria group bacterium]